MNCLVKAKLKCKRESTRLMPSSLSSLVLHLRMYRGIVTHSQVPEGKACSGQHPCQANHHQGMNFPSLSWLIVANTRQSKGEQCVRQFDF